MKAITQLSRLFVGVLFIISGLIKLNDPMGFSFKLEEYFSEAVLNLPSLYPYALQIALIMVIAEIVLGVSLLLGYAKRLTLSLLFLMIVFFTFLTFYSAYFNKVTDCGCFGDAVKLTPWGSFTKDIVLLVLILILIKYNKYITPFLKNKINTYIVTLSLVLSILMGYWVLNHLPFKDFRAYSVGTDIAREMEIPEDAPQAIYQMDFYYLVDGVETKFTDKELGNIPANSEFIRREDKLIQEGYTPSIHDLSFDKDGIDYLYDYLSEPKVVLVLTYDLNRADPQGMALMKDFANKAIANGYKVIGLTSSSAQKITESIEMFGLPFDYYTCDGTTLKTIERANPSIIILKDGVITQKTHWKDLQKITL